MEQPLILVDNTAYIAIPQKYNRKQLNPSEIVIYNNTLYIPIKEYFINMLPYTAEEKETLRTILLEPILVNKNKAQVAISYMYIPKDSQLIKTMLGTFNIIGENIEESEEMFDRNNVFKCGLVTFNISKTILDYTPITTELMLLVG